MTTQLLEKLDGIYDVTVAYRYKDNNNKNNKNTNTNNNNNDYDCTRAQAPTMVSFLRGDYKRVDIRIQRIDKNVIDWHDEEQVEALLGKLYHQKDKWLNECYQGYYDNPFRISSNNNNNNNDDNNNVKNNNSDNNNSNNIVKHNDNDDKKVVDVTNPQYSLILNNSCSGGRNNNSKRIDHNNSNNNDNNINTSSNNNNNNNKTSNNDNIAHHERRNSILSQLPLPIREIKVSNNVYMLSLFTLTWCLYPWIKFPRAMNKWFLYSSGGSFAVSFIRYMIGAF